MARPTTKQELLTASEREYAKLWTLIDSTPVDVQTAEFRTDGRDRDLRDVLTHLYEWHGLLLDWVRENRAGRAASFLPQPYNWNTYMQMNVELFWQRHRKTTLDEAKAMLRGSHAEVMALIDGFTDEELFTKKYFPWTGTTSLGSYCISATASHYVWAVKKLKQAFA